MKSNTRREFLSSALSLGAAGFFMAGCKTMDTVTQAMKESNLISDSQAASLNRVGTAVGKSFESFTPEQEYYIGRTIGAMVLETYPPYNNPVANAYLNRLGQTLATASDRPETYAGYRFMIQNSNEINAFAAPGGFIFVTRGLIHCCPDEDSLAGVLAHEISHVEKKHGLGAIQQSRITKAVTILGQEGTKHFGSGEVKNLTAAFSDTISDITHTLVVSGYSRGQEKEADLAAAELVDRVGYNPQGLMRMLDQMSSRLEPNARDFARTHPSPQDRMAVLKRVVGPYKPYTTPEQRRTRFFQQLSKV
ncbi:MAG: M48 family metalloprotease [Desulfobacter sp.]|nr:M48 family metalloprotease [Desulfobacter sp.]WDP84508.1 MAG: M48 family metalloprotease [Desulfobacter sp.]